MPRQRDQLIVHRLNKTLEPLPCRSWSNDGENLVQGRALDVVHRGAQTQGAEPRHRFLQGMEAICETEIFRWQDSEQVLIEQTLAAHPKIGVKVSRPGEQHVAVTDVVFLWDAIAGITWCVSDDPPFQLLDFDDGLTLRSQLRRLKWIAVDITRDRRERLHLPPLWDLAEGRRDTQNGFVAGEAEVDEPFAVEGAGHRPPEP